jgi:catechol 2,3-dioxygenase-like lactoylglutathione lyase family enzyme
MGILTNAKVGATLPVVDLDRAVKFYEDVLGLVPIKSPDSSRDRMYQAGGDTQLLIYKRGATKADHTAAGFQVNNIEEVVAALQAKGVVFQEYDLPEMGLKTVNGIAETGGSKVAWFFDTEENILGIFNIA